MRLKCDGHRNVIIILEPSMEASHYFAGESCTSSRGRDTITIGIINILFGGISLPENYSQMEEVQRVIIVVRQLPGLLLEEMIQRIK